MTRSSWFALAAFFLAVTVTAAQESGKSEESQTSEEKDWLEFYYQNPTPDRLVAEVKKMAEDGTLQNEGARPAIIAFLSQVFRQNPDKLAGWYQQLSGLSASNQQIIQTAMLFSRTKEADNLLRNRFGASFDKQKKELPKILELNLAQKETLDMVWGFFYATGSETAVRRVIWSFRFDDAPDNPDFAKIPKGHQPLYKVLPDAAAWTLGGNARHHPKVLEICEKLYADEKALVAPERRRLGDLLSELKPEKYPKKENSKPKTEPKPKPDA